jgi:hypothetical protein
MAKNKKLDFKKDSIDIFPKKTQLANRYMKKCLSSLIKEKNTMKCHLTPIRIRMTFIKKTRDKCWDSVERGEPLYTVGKIK